MQQDSHQISEKWLTAGDGARFRVTIVQPPSGGGQPPVIYLPGMFSTRGFWRSDSGVGIASYAAGQGFPGLIVERRESNCGARPGLEEHVRLDLPLAQAEAGRLWDRPALWMGHSFGGVLAARACAETLDQERIQGLILFASQFEVGKRPLHPPMSWLVLAMGRALGYFPASRVGLGPRDEPPAAMADAVRLVTLGRRRPQLRASLNRVNVPVLAISGLADAVDPTPGCRRFIEHFASTDKRFIAAGRSEGFSRDYGHPDIVASKAAAGEIWPLALEWMRDHTPASSTGA